MSSTAFDDQYLAAPEPMREPMSREAILRRNVADMEKELQRQSTMASHWRQQYAIIYDEMQGTPCAEIRWQHERKELTERAETAEAELVKFDSMKMPLYAAPVPAPHKGATHCDDCGLTWLDDGLNPLGCPYCKDPVPAPAVPAEWREVMAELAADVQAACDAEHPHRDKYPSVMRKYNNDMEIVEKARALLQSAEVRHDPR